MNKLICRIFNSFCGVGLIIGALFFFASLMPSLIPRNYVVQGVLSGIAFSAGYGIGVVLRQFWRYLELPGLPAYVLKYTQPVVSVIIIIFVFIDLYSSKGWQDSVRSAVGMDPVDSAYPISVFLISILSFGILLLIAR